MKWFLGILFLCFFSCTKSLELYDEIPKGSEETVAIHPLLQQPFTYLGEGSQVYAFVGEDDKIVLKVFKARHHKSFKFSRLLDKMKNQGWKQSHQKWRVKFHETCRRYKTAYLHLKEETGLVYLHFEKTPVSLPVTLCGQTIDLSKHPFILQKKAILAPDYIRMHPEKVSDLKVFFTERTKKGFSDPRQSLSINYGFVDDKPIQIDPGKLESFGGDQEAEIQKIHRRIDAWVIKMKK